MEVITITDGHHTVPKKDSSGTVRTWCAVLTVILLVMLLLQVNKMDAKVTEFVDLVKGTDGVAAPGAPPTAAPPPPAVFTGDMDDLMDDDAVKGDLDAPVTMVEWSDFECPFCGRFYSGAYKQIVSEYVDTGKVRFVYRDFPLSFHPQAQKAAEAAECAGEQGKFYEMHDLLFEKGVSGGVASFKTYASEIKLDTAKFNTCLDDGKMAAEVKKDMADGAAAGVTGTPGFIINGKLVSGAQPFEAFKAIIDAELAK